MLVNFLWISLSLYYCLQHINPAMYNTVKKEAHSQKMHLHVPKWLQEKKKRERRPHTMPSWCLNRLCKCTCEWRHPGQPIGYIIYRASCKMKMGSPCSKIIKNFKMTTRALHQEWSPWNQSWMPPPVCTPAQPWGSEWACCVIGLYRPAGRCLQLGHTFLFVNCESTNNKLEALALKLKLALVQNWIKLRLTPID